MPPKKLNNKFKSIKVKCPEGHEVVRYRKPKEEEGRRTHKIWLVEERLGRLVTEPPILTIASDGVRELTIPETGTEIFCGNQDCTLQIGEIALVKGTPAIELSREIMRQTKG